MSEASTQRIHFEFPKGKAVGWLYKSWSSDHFLMTPQESQLLHDACGSFDLEADPAELSLSCNNRALEDFSWIGKLPRNSINRLSLGNTKVQDTWIANLKPLDWLQELHLVKTRITDLSLEKLANLQSLKVLNLETTQIRGSGLTQLGKLKQLQELSLECCPLEPSHISALASCSSLMRLRLSETGLDEDNYKGLLKLKKLRNLDLGFNKVADKAVAAIVSSLPDLESISLNSTQATASGLTALCTSKKLISINFGDCDLSKSIGIVLPKSLKSLSLMHAIGIDDKFVQSTDLSGLTALHLGSTKVSLRSLPRISKLPQLEKLYLENIDLSAADIGLLGKLKRMKVLRLRGCKINNSQLSFLGQLKALRDLDLSHNQKIGEEAVKTLGSCSSLKFISLSHTNFSRNAILALRKSLPACRVEHESY